MANLIISAILVVTIGAAIGYIVKAKKSGVKCIGCSAACNCSGAASTKCSCGEAANSACCCSSAK